MIDPILATLVLAIAFLYASVGFGGASGYLAAMSIYNIPAPIAASTALLLNIVVAGVAFFHYSRDGHLKARLLWPFVLASIPAAFLGGNFRLSQFAYQVLLNMILLYLGLRMLLANGSNEADRRYQLPSLPLAMASGAVIGLISGIVGVGGGIFLSPLIQLARWGDSKQASAASAGFILLNSLSGLTGRYFAGTLNLGEMGAILIPLGVGGGVLGSYLGARRFSNKYLQWLLGSILLITVFRFLLSIPG